MNLADAYRDLPDDEIIKRLNLSAVIFGGPPLSDYAPSMQVLLIEAARRLAEHVWMRQELEK